jgi:hypothetical protein
MNPWTYFVLMHVNSTKTFNFPENSTTKGLVCDIYGNVQLVGPTRSGYVEAKEVTLRFDLSGTRVGYYSRK